MNDLFYNIEGEPSKQDIARIVATRDQLIAEAHGVLSQRPDHFFFTAARIDDDRMQWSGVRSLGGDGKETQGQAEFIVQTLRSVIDVHATLADIPFHAAALNLFVLVMRDFLPGDDDT